MADHLMAGRIRSLKPEAFRSKDLCRVPVPVRWTFAGLWCFADDEGRMEDDPLVISSDLYLRDPDMTPEVVDEHLADLAKADLIHRYEVDETRYLHVITMREHQHPKRFIDSKLPPCEVQHGDQQDPMFPHPGDSGGNMQGTPSTKSAPVVVEEGSSRGRGESVPHPGARRGPPPRFAEFWKIYPRRAARPKAEEAWAKAITKADPALILAAAASYRDRPGRTPEFTAHPTTWLNQERWADEDAAPGPPRQRDEDGTGTGTVAPYQPF
jgi:hypothetical protein